MTASDLPDELQRPCRAQPADLSLLDRIANGLDATIAKVHFGHYGRREDCRDQPCMAATALIAEARAVRLVDPEPILRRAAEATAKRDAEVEQRVRHEMLSGFLAGYEREMDAQTLRVIGERNAALTDLTAARATLAEVLDTFHEPEDHPGYEAQRSDWVPLDQLDRWRAALAARQDEEGEPR